MSKANILLIDDETAFLDAMKRRLGKRDFSVETATGGMQGLEILEASSNSIEVVVLDVKMPGMDGIETLGEIKRKFPLVEVIMLTGHATVSSAIEGMKRGAFDYLMKPADIDSFTEKIVEAAEKRRQQEQKIIEARMKAITTRHA
ncbi:MAG: response regulator [Desulfobacterales bacterium]|jgi:DNA-binding NtrC family response regulator|nr:response regulator [Desulfobacterales bacterium]